MLKTVYHIDAGETELYEIDARAAVQNFPKEWSDKPWSEKKATKAAEADADAAAKAKADADAKAKADTDAAAKAKADADAKAQS
jgi:hypothetical protein